MPRFCTLIQLNKSAQELATHIGEVVINKCFCTRRNPISISAAAIYLACQLEDKRKTQAEICKVTGLTEVTLRKVYKELLENWDDLLPANYTPADEIFSSSFAATMFLKINGYPAR
ncbi:Plant-specific tfiib-related protein [Thalictrum thalictroides]|uniref:Plant-specific tfiib-related protein n=1 Tax=Thalictrum thalictroides TaxID=46969 RepID=A0A7J6W317_THATH|nr:Plant-specific tfiib-related protein [Thalictrum thalictroides]